MDIIDKINALLRERGMTGAELSRIIGVSNAVYSQWNKKKTNPSNKNLLKIATTLGVPVSALTGEEKDPPQGRGGPVPPQEYAMLTPEQRETVDAMIRLLASQNQG